MQNQTQTPLTRRRKYIFLLSFEEPSSDPTTRIMLEKPTSINHEMALFHFQIDDDPEIKVHYMNTADILAVSNQKHGTMRIRECSGKYTILNPTLFSEYVEKQIINLRREADDY